jgi:hypothetical protein
MRWAAKLCALVMAAAGLHSAAQTGAISWQAIDQYGQPLPHAQVRVCSATSTGVPCNPTVPIFLDYNLTTPVSNPYAADAFGNFSFYVPALPFPNVYLIQLTPASGITWSYLFDGPGGTGGSGCVTAGAAGTLVASNGSGGCSSAFIQVNSANLASPIAPNFVNSATVTVNNLGTNQISFTAAATGLASFSAGNFNPFFTTSLGGDPTHNPALAFTAVSNANFTFPGNFSGSGGAWTPWTLAAGSNITLTPSGSTLTIAAAGGTSGCVTSGVTGQLQGADGSGGCAPEDVKVNGTNLTSRIAPNFVAGTNTTVSNPGTNQIAINVSSTPAALQPLVVPPVVGQYIILRPTISVAHDDNGRTTSVCQANGTSASGQIFQAFASSSFPPAYGYCHYSGFVLPAGIPTGNVTAVYAYGISETAGHGQNLFPNACSSAAVTPSGTTWLQTQTTTGTGISGSGIAAVTCVVEMSNSGANPGATTSNLDDIGLIVYYTGTVVPNSTALNIAAPLSLNSATNTLGLDPSFPAWLNGIPVAQLPSATNLYFRLQLVRDGANASDCSAGGGTTPVLCWSNGTSWAPYGSTSAISGMTAGQVAIAATATTITSSKPLAGSGSGVTTGPTTASAGDCVQFTGAGGQIADSGSGCSGGGAGYTNVVPSASGDTTVAAINAKCNGGQTYWASIPLSIATGGTIASGCNVMFVKGGLWTIASGQTVTFANPIIETDGPSQHFTGSGAVVLAPQNAHAEWWGWVGDGSLIGNSGTDNTAAWAAAYAAMTNGKIIIPCAQSRFATTGPAVTKSNIGIAAACQLSLGVSANHALDTPMIFTSSATATVVSFNGGSSSTVITGNSLSDLAVARAVTPTTGAIGINVTYVGGFYQNRVYSNDSIKRWNLEYTPSYAIGGFFNSGGDIGHSGISCPTGTTYGWYLGADGVSTRMDRDSDANNCGITTFGLYWPGNGIDYMIDHFEVAGGGVSGSTGIGNAGGTMQDVHIDNPILDNVGKCIALSGGSGFAQFQVTINGGDGWCAATASNTAISIDHGAFFNLNDMLIYSGSVVLTHDTTSTVSGLNFRQTGATAAYGIQLDSSVGVILTNNSMQLTGTQTGINLIASTDNPIQANTIGGGSGSVCIAYDATSVRNPFAENNTFGCTTPFTDAGTGNQSVYGGTTGSIGGGSLAAGACTSGTATVAGTVTTQAASASPNTYPGDGFTWNAYVSAAGTVTVKLCNGTGTTGTPSSGTYNVRVQ